MTLAGKVAFITGAGRGQGRAHALRLAQDGADVILLDICSDIDGIGLPMATRSDLEETAKLVRDLGRKAVTGVADVRSLAQVQAVVDAGLAELGRIDVVVANAGVLEYGLAWEFSEQEWDAVVDVDLKGVWTTARAAIPSMIERGEGGSIILTSSTAGIRGSFLMAHYTAAKHGVVGLARALAIELGRYNIRVNTIHPRGVDTLMAQDPRVTDLFNTYPEEFGPLGSALLSPERLQPEDVAEVVSFLASDAARHITGVRVPVDRGQTARA
jgi:(+)-trans-carveol dehydrogenase